MKVKKLTEVAQNKNQTQFNEVGDAQVVHETDDVPCSLAYTCTINKKKSPKKN